MSSDLREFASELLLMRGRHISEVAIVQLAPHYLDRHITDDEAAHVARLCREATITIELPDEETA